MEFGTGSKSSVIFIGDDISSDSDGLHLWNVISSNGKYDYIRKSVIDLSSIEQGDSGEVSIVIRVLLNNGTC